MNKINPKFDAAVTRLVTKIRQSQVPVPGFIIGLSGTDSIVAYAVLFAACRATSLHGRLLGVHYVTPGRPRPTWFETDIVPWLRRWSEGNQILVEEPLGGNHDPQRWADLHLRSMNHVSTTADGRVDIKPFEDEPAYWTSGSINATEHRLGTHTILADAVSVQPIRSLWKTDVLATCRDIGVPEAAMERARIPDCFCGRDELAAQNIELIDEILTSRIDPTEHDPALLKTLFEYVREQTTRNGFRQRIPYVV